VQKKCITSFLSILGSLIVLPSCQFGVQKSSEKSFKLSSSAESGEVRNFNERNPIEDKLLAAQYLSASLKQDITEKPELKPVVERILSQPEKFNELVETCSVKTSPTEISKTPKSDRTQIQFTNFFNLSNNQYILYLQCSTGAYQPSGVYFLFSNINGIQTKPLKLTKLIGYESNHPKEVAISSADSQSITGYHRFDNDKKELSLTYRCDGQWSCFSKSRYTVINNQPVLQEYSVGNRIGSQDGRYTVYRFIRDRDEQWLSSGVTKCKERFVCLRSRNE
jgi:hypothetical protein